MTWIGFLATLLLVVVLGVTALREPNRQAEAQISLQTAAVLDGMELYAVNCVACHGAAGEGLTSTPALDSEGLRGMDEETLFRTIERGRYNTAMAAFGVGEGGIFTDAQIENLISLIQYGAWDVVATRVDALGLTPPPVVAVELTEDTLAQVRALPDGETLAAGLTVFAENCTACHGGNGEGSTLAPALNSADLRVRLTDADIERIVTQGVPGTLMAAWGGALQPQEVTDLIALLRGWEALDAAGVALAAAPPPVLDMSPEAIAAGGQLYSVLCTQCHGVTGYGTRLAPALNNQLFLNQTPDAAIQQIIAGGVTGTAMPAWGGRLTEADIAALTAYLRSWEPTAPPIVQP
jgi:cbb3-type cytochrome c oxidase subunit III